MAKLPRVHPFRVWRNDHSISLEKASALIEAQGFSFKPRTVLAMEDGWRHAAYEVCKVIEKKITKGAVTVDELRSWPLREVSDKGSTKAKRAA